MEVAAALVLGIVGAVTGVAALAWQVITWRKSGAVVRVTATQAFPAYGGSSEQFLNVTARNTGRSPVTVKGGDWGSPMAGPWSSPILRRGQVRRLIDWNQELRGTGMRPRRRSPGPAPSTGSGSRT